MSKIINEFNEGVILATTPFPITALLPIHRGDLKNKFIKLFPHTLLHDFSPLFCKGRTALFFLLEQLKRYNPRKNIVILPAYGAQSLAYATIAAKLMIELCDIKQNSFFYDLNELKSILVNNRNKILTVIAPYMWGILCIDDVRQFHNMLDEFGVLYVDDFATTQILDSKAIEHFKNLSPISLFSFGGTKVLSLFNGGLLTYSKEKLKYFSTMELQLSEKSFSRETYISRGLIFNWIYWRIHQNRRIFSRMGKFELSKDMYPTDITIQKRLLSRNWESVLSYLINRYESTIREKRISNNYRYQSMFKEFGLPTFSPFNVPKIAIGSRYPILLQSNTLRNYLVKTLLAKKFLTSRGYIHAIPNVDCIRPYLSDRNINVKNFPKAIEYEERLLTFPNHFLIEGQDLELVRQTVENYYK